MFNGSNLTPCPVLMSWKPVGKPPEKHWDLFVLQITGSKSNHPIAPTGLKKKKNKLVRDGLFDAPDVKARIPLQKVPFDFYYSYSCQTSQGITQYRHKITDWEACALYWNCQRDYQQNWEKYFRLKLEEDFSQNRELMYLMGTMHRFPDKWLIVGLLYPPKAEARQRALFLSPPSD